MKKDIHPKYNTEAKVKNWSQKRERKADGNVEISARLEKKEKEIRPSSSSSSSPPLVSGQTLSSLLPSPPRFFAPLGKNRRAHPAINQSTQHKRPPPLPS